jgi:hypothetical protein
MRRYSKLLLLLPVVVLLTTAWSCNQTTAQKIINKVAVLNKGYADSVMALHKGGDLTDDQERQHLGWSRRVAEIGTSASSAFLAGDNAAALTQINLGIGVLDDALNNGLLGIKNETKKNEISAAILAIRGLFTTAATFLTAPKTAQGGAIWQQQPQSSLSFA